MVYKLFDDDGVRNYSNKKRQPITRIRLPQWHIQTESRFANFLVTSLRLLLFAYDILTWPIYFLAQRPDRQAKEAQQTRSERVDINTWIRTSAALNSNKQLPIHGRGSKSLTAQRRRASSLSASIGANASQSPNHKITYKYMGATLSEIFANAIASFSNRRCLGYRAVVTCPVLSMNEEGEHVMQDKSFRSDYTWYTYEQIGRRVQDLASGLYHYSIYPGSRALFLASTCLEWFCASQACLQLAGQIVTAPQVNDSSDQDSSLLRLILREAEIDVIFVTCDKLKKLCRVFNAIASDAEELGVAATLHIKLVVIIDWQFTVDFSEPAFAQLQRAARHMVDSIASMGQVEEVGIENPIELCCTNALRDDEDPNGAGEYDRPARKASRSTFKDDLVMPTGDHTPQFLRSPATPSAPLTSPLSRRRVGRLPGRPMTAVSPEPTRAARRLSARPWGGASPADESLGRRFVSRGSSPRLSVHEFLKLDQDPPTKAKPDDVAMLVYTRGSMGQARALKFTHSYLARSSHYLFLDGMVNGEDVHCSSLALENVIEFMTEMCIFSHGGAIGFSSNLETLFYDGKELFRRDRSDLEALSPSFLLVRPYILESLRTSVQNYLSLEMNPLASFLLTNVIFDYKRYWARRHFGTPIVDRLFCSRPKSLFGTNIKYILCNGATDCTETKDFFAFMLNIPVIELYGPDEALVSLMSVNDIWDYKRRRKSATSAFGWRSYLPTMGIFSGNPQFGHKDTESNRDEPHEDFFKDMQLLPPKVNRNTFREDSSRNLLITSSILCPTLGARIRLDDWEDFRTSDLPYPRGRLIIGGDVVCKGYFKRPEASARVFLTDSNMIAWFKTDDIARVFPNGSFEIISAINDMMKMSDGQFISLSQIEHILRNSQFVDNACVICGPDRRFVIALVVPNLRRLALKSPGEANLKSAMGTEPEPEELLDVEFRREVCNDRLLAEFVSEHLSALISRAGLEAVQKRFLLVPEMWTPETELVTPAFEPKRAAIQKFYAADIQSIFKMEFSSSKSNKKRLSARLLAERRKFSR